MIFLFYLIHIWLECNKFVISNKIKETKILHNFYLSNLYLSEFVKYFPHYACFAVIRMNHTNLSLFLKGVFNSFWVEISLLIFASKCSQTALFLGQVSYPQSQWPFLGPILLCFILGKKASKTSDVFGRIKISVRMGEIQ